MLNPATEGLEVAQAIHSLLERWSIDVFLAVVAMDVFLHLAETSTGLEWRCKWNGLSVRGLRFIAYDGRLSVRAIAKTLSLIGFGVAISLEFFAIPYGERTDELTAKDAAKSQLRVVAAFSIAANANKGAADVRLRAGTLESGLEKERQKTARLQKEARQAEADTMTRMGYLQRRQLGRILMNPEAFVKSLLNKPKARVEIVYAAGSDPEPYSLASQIGRWLGVGAKADGAGWSIIAIRPLREDDAIPMLTNQIPDAPLVMRAGAENPGVIAIASMTGFDPLDLTSSHAGALLKAILDSGNGGGLVWVDPRLQEDAVRVIIGPR